MSTGTPPHVVLDVQYHQAPRSPRRPHGRWAWALSGLTVLLLSAVPLGLEIASAGVGGGAFSARPDVRALTITQPVASVSVRSYGGDIRVIGGGTSRVRVTATVSYDSAQGQAPRVTDAVSGGRLALAAPACAELNCSVAFTLRVPASVSVTATADGGNVVVSGVAGASLDSGGGTVTATSVSGPLTVTSEGGNQYLAGVDGTLAAQSGGGDMVVEALAGPAATIATNGGNLTAMGMAVPSATLSSGGGNARIGFVSPPASMTVTASGGNATVLVPGGPYALTADSAGGPQVVGIATSPAARASLTVTTGGGSLVIEPGTGGPAFAPARAGRSAFGGP